GTPSRLGLLLDISPRNLERVLYFASYLVTSVDEEKRDELVRTIYAELEAELEELDQELATRTGQITSQVEADLANLRQGAESLSQNAEQRLAEEQAALDAEVAALR